MSTDLTVIVEHRPAAGPATEVAGGAGISIRGLADFTGKGGGDARVLLGEDALATRRAAVERAGISAASGKQQGARVASCWGGRGGARPRGRRIRLPRHGELCLDGALTGKLAAYLAAIGDDRIGSVMLLDTMLDHSEPGVLGAFMDERTVTPGEGDGGQGLPGGQPDGRHIRPAAGSRPHLQPRGGGLADGPGSLAFDLLAWNADSNPAEAAAWRTTAAGQEHVRDAGRGVEAGLLQLSG
jgi:hypothetical protein